MISVSENGVRRINIEVFNMTKQQKEIILSYAENNMSASLTARVMMYHRNSIEYHLDQVHKEHNLNPKNFYDLVELVRIAKGEMSPKDVPCKIGDQVAVVQNDKGKESIQIGVVSEMYFTNDMELMIVVKHISRGQWGIDVFASVEDALIKFNQRL